MPIRHVARHIASWVATLAILIAVILSLWILYRVARGWLGLSSSAAMPVPD